MRLSSTLLAVAALSLAGPSLAQPDDGPPRPELPALGLDAQMTDAEIGAALDPWFANLTQSGLFNGAVVVARDGREVFARGYGLTGLTGSAAIGPDTRFPIASIGKAFTHVAIAQLIQQGRLTPETTIADVIPDYPNNVSRSATIAELLDHRAGIADIFGPAFRDAPKSQFLSNADYYRFVSAHPPMFAPGEAQEYCNGCYVVLGEIIARVSGQRYEAYVAEHVFAPAGAIGCAYLRHDQLPDDVARFVGRPSGPGTPVEDVSRFHGFAGSAAGNPYCSVRDLLAFDDALREQRLLNAELTAQVLRGEPQAGRHTRRIGFAGGGPGVNGLLFGNGAWTVIVLANRPEPAGEVIGETVFSLLAGPRPQ